MIMSLYNKVILTSFVIAALAGCGRAGVQGSLEVYRKDGLPVNSQTGNPVQTLQSGPIMIQEQGKLLVFLGQQQEPSIALPADQKIFTSEEFKLDYDAIDQPFSLSGKKIVSNLSHVDKIQKESCNYTGFCYTCFGSFSADCGYQFSNICIGETTVKRRYSKRKLALQLEFWDPDRSELWANFTTTRQTVTESHIVETISSCR